MNNIFLVIENNNESYEDNMEWPLAAFDNEDKAKEYAFSKQQEYNLSKAIGLAQNDLMILEEEAYYADGKEDDRPFNRSLYEKYPNYVSPHSEYHYFYVSKPIPFNPS